MYFIDLLIEEKWKCVTLGTFVFQFCPLQIYVPTYIFITNRNENNLFYINHLVLDPCGSNKTLKYVLMTNTKVCC